jgi:hypothetical protein
VTTPKHFPHLLNQLHEDSAQHGCFHGWSLQQLDVNNAFLNGLSEEAVYMTQPLGFETHDKSIVRKLKRAIHSLKQALRAWFVRFKAILLKFHFRASK